jgi:hypothetical protein
MQVAEHVEPGQDAGQERRAEPDGARRDGRQDLERVAQRDEVARVRGAERAATEQALQVVDLVEKHRERLALLGPLREERDRLEARLDRLAAGERTHQPVAQEPPAHRRPGPVDHREEGTVASAVARVLDDLERPAGRRVEHHDLGHLVPGDPGHVTQVGLLRLLEVRQERPRRAGGEILPLAAEPLERRGAEALQESAVGGVPGEPPGGDRRQQQSLEPLARQKGVRGGSLAVHDLAWREAGQDLDQRVTRARAAILAHPEIAGGEIEDGAAKRGGVGGRRRAATSVVVSGDDGDVVRLARRQVGRVGEGAGGDHPGDGAAHDPLRLARVLHLVADRHPIAVPDEPRDVTVGGVIGDAAHRRFVAGSASAGGERQRQRAAGDPGVVVEHLVEVAETEHQNRVRVLRLHLAILPEHRGQRVHRSP